MKISDLKKSEFDPYYGLYIYKLSDQVNLREGFEIGNKNVIKFFKSIPENKLDFRYAPEKWSVKEIFQHLIDSERIFIYRCFRIARKDTTPLAEFNQEIYIEPSNVNNKTIEDLVDEFKLTRQYSISLLNSLSDEDLKCIGVANGVTLSARAAAFTIIVIGIFLELLPCAKFHVQL